MWTIADQNFAQCNFVKSNDALAHGIWVPLCTANTRQKHASHAHIEARLSWADGGEMSL
jgi:hypothetical protein